MQASVCTLVAKQSKGHLQAPAMQTPMGYGGICGSPISIHCHHPSPVSYNFTFSKSKPSFICICCIVFNGLGSNLGVNLIIIKVFPGTRISPRHKWPYLASTYHPPPVVVLGPYWIWNPPKPWSHKLKSHSWFRSENLIKASDVARTRIKLTTFNSLSSWGWGPYIGYLNSPPI